MSDNTTDLLNSGLIFFPENHGPDTGKINDLFSERPATAKISSFSHWPELHIYQYTTEDEARSFFADWWNRRPKACGCEDAEVILADNPMDFSSPDKFFESGVRLHNAVNAKLAAEQPERYHQWSVETARKTWKPQTLPNE